MDRRNFLKGASSLVLVHPLIGFALPGVGLNLPVAKPDALPPLFVVPTVDDFGTRVSLVAIGGAGVAMVNRIDKARYGLHKIIAIDTSARALKNAKADHVILLNDADKRKPATANLAWELGEQQRAIVEREIADAHLVIIVAGMGGTTGTGVALSVAAAARRQNALTVAFAVTPFAFEAQQRQINSAAGIQALQSVAHSVTIVSNERLAQQFATQASFTEVIAQGSTALHHFLWNTSGCLTHPGLVGIDFEDIRTVLDSRGLSGIGWGEAVGDKRAEQAVQQALSHATLIPAGPTTLQSVGVSIRAANKTLRMKEINTVMNQIKTSMDRLSSSDGHVIFSADYDETLGQSMQISVLANWVKPKGSTANLNN